MTGAEKLMGVLRREAEEVEKSESMPMHSCRVCLWRTHLVCDEVCPLNLCMKKEQLRTLINLISPFLYLKPLPFLKINIMDMHLETYTTLLCVLSECIFSRL